MNGRKEEPRGEWQRPVESTDEGVNFGWKEKAFFFETRGNKGGGDSLCKLILKHDILHDLTLDSSGIINMEGEVISEKCDWDWMEV